MIRKMKDKLHLKRLHLLDKTPATFIKSKSIEFTVHVQIDNFNRLIPKFLFPIFFKRIYKLQLIMAGKILGWESAYLL